MYTKNQDIKYMLFFFTHRTTLNVYTYGNTNDGSICIFCKSKEDGEG